MVEDWNDMEKIWSHVYSEELKCASEEHPVLLTEAPLNPRQHRDQAAQIFFETFNAPALYISIQAVLSLYASGRTTGVVLDSGDGVSHTVPVYEGFAIPNAIKRTDVAGRDITEHLQFLLRKSGHIFSTSAEKEIIRMIKEKACYVSLNAAKEEKEKQGKYEDFVLPDGNLIKVFFESFDFSLELNDFTRQRYYLILNSLEKKCLVFMKILLILFKKRTWIYEKIYMQILFYQVAPPSSKVRYEAF
jgi:centractin